MSSFELYLLLIDVSFNLFLGPLVHPPQQGYAPTMPETRMMIMWVLRTCIDVCMYMGDYFNTFVFI